MSRNRPQPRLGATEYSMQCDTCRTSLPTNDRRRAIAEQMAGVR